MRLIIEKLGIKIMGIIEALLHLFGAILVNMGIGVAGLFAMGWEQSKLQEKKMRELSIKLGIPIDEIESAEHIPKLSEFFSEKYSSEHFSNRLSDVFGFIRMGWYAIILLVQGAILIFTLYGMFKGNLEASVIFWFIPVLSVTSFIILLPFSLICKLLTNRYPGEAHNGRKFLTNYLSENGY